MDVCFGDGGDLDAFVVRHLDVLANVATGIDDDSFLSPLATDEIGSVGQLLIVEILEQHVLVHL